MYTNLVAYGGNFRSVLDSEFKAATNVTIASGYASLDIINAYNSEFISYGHDSGVYVTNGRRYHGKVYHFERQSESSIYVGSSNFSTSGTKNNIECTLPVTVPQQQVEITEFLEELYSQNYAIKI